MPKTPKWNELTHDDKLRALRDTALDQISKDYDFEELGPDEVMRSLRQEQILWQPTLYEGKGTQIDAPPNKEVILGAWRDLDRSEAILELIDNSIDAWTRRKRRYPDKSAPELNIYIDIDSDVGQLTYDLSYQGTAKRML
jgi:hypothetical protein